LQVAFLVLGPVVAAKLAALYGDTFRRHFVLQADRDRGAHGLAGALVFEVVIG
jgi:hypothetical protein